MAKITSVILSKDRACQLDALLSSIDRFAKDKFDLSVIYLSSNQFYEDGYNKLMELRKNEGIRFIKEVSFRGTITETVEAGQSNCCILLTDDSIFFRPLGFDDDSLFALFDKYRCYTFSPRCGYNTQQQCHWEKIFQKPISPVFEEGEVVIWDFTKQDYCNDYGRPVSLDGNINHRLKLLEAMKGSEWNWCGGLDGIHTGPLQPYMAAYKHSILTNIPVNSTHGEKATNWGKYIRFTFEDFNAAFLNGERANVDKMDFSNVYGGHQEIGYVLE